MRPIQFLKVIFAKYGADIALYGAMVIMAMAFNFALFVAFDKEQDNAQERAILHQLKHQEATEVSDDYAYIAPADKAIIEMRQRE